MLNLFDYTAPPYDPDHILTRKELGVLATLLGGMKEIEFILEGGDFSIKRIERSLKEKGLNSVVDHLEEDLRKGNYMNIMSLIMHNIQLQYRPMSLLRYPHLIHTYLLCMVIIIIL